jgi:hypothetical protein
MRLMIQNAISRYMDIMGPKLHSLVEQIVSTQILDKSAERVGAQPRLRPAPSLQALLPVPPRRCCCTAATAAVAASTTTCPHPPGGGVGLCFGGV